MTHFLLFFFESRDSERERKAFLVRCFPLDGWRATEKRKSRGRKRKDLKTLVRSLGIYPNAVLRVNGCKKRKKEGISLSGVGEIEKEKCILTIDFVNDQ